MRALILDEGELRLDPDHPEPEVGPADALVHVRRASVCATDLEILRGYGSLPGYRGVLGHEFVGELDDGRRVVADINIGCGACRVCASEGGRHCPARTTLGIRDRPGVFAERVAIPRANLIEVPDGLDDELAVFAEPLAAALHVLDEPCEGPTTVLGDGKLGLLIALALHAEGRAVELIGRHPTKLEIAAGVGVATLLEAELGDDPRPRAAMVVDATGSPGGLRRAMQLAWPRATIVLKTTTKQPAPIDLSPIVVHELRVVGSRCGDLRRAIAVLASGRLDPRALITARYPLAQATRALEHAGEPGSLATLIVP
jgi:threonine dehydrogenase-like Zn-dependent dehydrogenase